MKFRLLAAAALALLLSACAAQKPRELPPVPQAQAEQLQLQREQALRGRSHWGFSGRVAVSNGKDGGSGRIDWQQQGADYSVQLSAPVTRQSWKLSVVRGNATIEGLEGGVRRGRDAGALVLQATGWDIPLAALSDWVRGVRGKGAAVAQYDAQGRLAHLEQAGWAIDYRWPEQTAELPSRIDATRGAAKVKLLVDAWQDGAVK